MTLCHDHLRANSIQRWIYFNALSRDSPRDINQFRQGRAWLCEIEMYSVLNPWSPGGPFMVQKMAITSPILFF